jgi:hypothetical protein
VLAVVEHEKESAVGQRGAQELARRPAGGRLAHAERPERGLGHQSVSAEARQLDQAHAVTMPIRDPPGDLQCQSCLARAANPGERDEPPGREEIDHLAQFTLTPHERRRRRRQAARVTRRGLERRERRLDTLRDGLVEPNRPHDVAQPVHAQVAQRDVRRRLRDESDRRVRDDDLPSVGDGHDPGRLVERHAEQLVAYLGDLARVNRHADADGGTARPGLCGQRALGLDSCGHRVARRPEEEDAAVAPGGIAAAPAHGRGAREDCALALDHPDERIAERPEQRRGPLHVGEEQCHDPRGLHPGRAGAAGGNHTSAAAINHLGLALGG